MARFSVRSAPDQERLWPRALAHPEQRVLPVAGVGPHLPGPAASLDGARPLRTDEHVRTVDLEDRAVDRALVRHRIVDAADADRKGLALETDRGAHARHLKQKGNV